MTTDSKHVCILAIAPSARGFGYALIENKNLQEWATRQVRGAKNVGSLKGIEELIDQYLPNVIVLPDASMKGSRRKPRIRRLIQEIVDLARKRKIRSKLLSRRKVAKTFFPNGRATKYDLAVMLAERFPRELGDRLPIKRKPWMTEDARMDMFDAVAFGLAFSLKFTS